MATPPKLIVPAEPGAVWVVVVAVGAIKVIDTWPRSVVLTTGTDELPAIRFAVGVPPKYSNKRPK